MIEAGGLHRRFAAVIWVGCDRPSLNLCILFGVRHREHETVTREQLYSLVAGRFIRETQLNASDLQQKTRMLVSGFRKCKVSQYCVPGYSGRNSEWLRRCLWSGQRWADCRVIDLVVFYVTLWSLG